MFFNSVVEFWKNRRVARLKARNMLTNSVQNSENHTMSSTQDIQNSRLKLAQLWHIQKTICLGKLSSREQIIKNVIKDDFDINYKFTISKSAMVKGCHLKDCTALHMMYSEPAFELDLFNIILDRGADFTIKNGNGQTVVHWIVTTYRDDQYGSATYRSLFIKSILEAHIQRQIFTNPIDDNGISHLHGACLANHIESLNFFLDNGNSVDKAVNFDSMYFPGYTPLHFAAMFASFKVVQVLIDRGANINAKDAKGMTPLDVCVNYRADKFAFAVFWSELNESFKYDVSKRLENNERIIKLLMEKQCVYTGDLTNFHIACMYKDVSVAQNLLNSIEDVNIKVPSKSSVCPGFTAAHFAAIMYLEPIKMIAKFGVKLDIENDDGLTALDMRGKFYDIQTLYDTLLCSEDCKEIYMSDGQTKLLDIILSMREVDDFKAFLQCIDVNIYVPEDSSVLANCTILHIAVILSAKDETLVEECLVHRPNINAKNSRDLTVLHLAYKLRKKGIIKLLLKHLNELDVVFNHMDSNNLSYLHIACANRDKALVEKLSKNSDVNVVYNGRKKSMFCKIGPGSTPLHVAVAKDSTRVVRVLLRYGADIHATDAYGLTPIHWLLKCYSRKCRYILFKKLLKDPKDYVVEDFGLSYLHVACYHDHMKAAKKLIELGSDVKAVINHQNTYSPDDDVLKWFVKVRSKYTPLTFVANNYKQKCSGLLLRQGADIFIQYNDSPNEVYDDKVRHCLMSVLWNDPKMQKIMEARFGLTKLHIACYVKKEKDIKKLLDNKVDVNARVNVDSIIHAGCTPLHLLISCLKYQSDNERLKYNLESIIKLLLDRGADVTIANTEQYTPIHLLQKCISFREQKNCKKLLINAHHDFNINPVDAKGMSHFHIACLWHEVNVIKKFLIHGSVDLNRPVDYFAEEYGGSTPLHLALKLYHKEWKVVMETVDLLCKYGADINAVDVHGDTPLHEWRELNGDGIRVLEKLVSYGADMTIENVRGRTPLSNLSFSRNLTNYPEICEKFKCQADIWNRLTGEGYIGKAILSAYHRDGISKTKLENLLKASGVKNVDEMNRTAIHNSVAAEYQRGAFENDIYAIELFMKEGISIDHQDDSGKTALHYAARFRNSRGTHALLYCGADINIVDNSGNSAFVCAKENINNSAEFIRDYSLDNQPSAVSYYLHVEKLKNLRLEVSQVNCDLAKYIHGIIVDYETKCNISNIKYNVRSPEKLIRVPQEFFSQVELTKDIKIGVNNITLFDFLSETSVVTLYPYLSLTERTVIDDFFNSDNFNELTQIIGILKLQFLKMKTRLKLIDSAFNSLRTLLNFSLPGLCEEIARFLTNSDLKNLIASTFEEESNEKEM